MDQWVKKKLLQWKLEKWQKERKEERKKLPKFISVDGKIFNNYPILYDITYSILTIFGFDRSFTSQSCEFDNAKICQNNRSMLLGLEL